MALNMLGVELCYRLKVRFGLYTSTGLRESFGVEITDPRELKATSGKPGEGAAPSARASDHPNPGATSLQVV